MKTPAAKTATKKRVKSSRSAVALPRIDPQLAAVAGDVPEGRDWLHEIAHDGARIVACLDGGDAELRDDTDRDRTRKFARIAAALTALAKGRTMILDGIVAAPESYFVFDLLWLGDADLRDRPLWVRKQRLKALLKGAKSPIVYVDHVLGGLGRDLYGDVVRAGGTGIVSKRRHAHYVGGPSDTWLEIKPDAVRARYLDQLRKSLEGSAPAPRSTKTKRRRRRASAPD